MLTAGLAELFDLQPVLMQFFVFCRRVISIFTNRAL
jgi:hypothetical protein